MVRCPSCDANNPDGSQRCRECATALALVCARCQAGNPRLARFCCGCGSRLESAPEFAHKGAFASPELRQITVLFCDLVGSVALARTLDPEDLHRLLQRLHSRSGEIVARHHGHVAQFLGDGLLAYFGYPVAAEDAPRSAVAAGLELVREVREIEGAPGKYLNVRVGIHTGPVVVANVGSALHQESLAVGETPSLAARIQEIAPVGSVVVSRETHRLVAPFFECEALGAFQLKGFAEPVTLHRVGDALGPATRIEAASITGLTPLVARERELDVLSELWAAASAGDGRAVLLMGEAGIGKSRLLHDVKQWSRAEHARCLELRCSEPARSSAFHPLLEALRRGAEILPGEAPGVILEKLSGLLSHEGFTSEQVALVATLFGVPLTPGAYATPALLRAALLDVLSMWISGGSSSRPRLLLVEDLHWADPSTLELLGPVIARAPGLPLFVALTARPEFSAESFSAANLRRIQLERLGADDMRTLIAHVAHHKTLPEPVLHALSQRAEGIPLFLEEMTKSVLQSGALRETDDSYVLGATHADPAIPTSLHDSLMGRLDRLGHGKPVAQVAAVLGREFDFPLFEAVWRRLRALPRVNLAEGLERLVDAQLVLRRGEAPNAAYQFRHALIQEAAYESLLRSARREYHLATATALREAFPAQVELEPEMLGHHYAGAGVNDQAVLYFDKAGQRGIAGSAYAEAVGHFRAALAQLDGISDVAARARLEIDVRSRLGVALITTGGFAAPAVEETYSRAAELSAELGTELPLRVVYGIWVVNLVRSDFASTERMVPNLERLAERPLDRGSALVVHAMLGAHAFFRADYRRAITHCEAAMERYDWERPKAQNDALLAEHGFEGFLYPALYLTWTRVMLADREGAQAAFRGADTICRAIDEPYISVGAMAFEAAMYHDFGDIVRAGEVARRMRAISEERGFVLWLSIAITLCGSAQFHAGERDAGLATVKQGLDLMRNVGAKNIWPYYSTYLAELLLEQGDASATIALVDDALAMTRKNVDCFAQPELLRLRGEAEVLRGDRRAALRYFEEARALAAEQGGMLYLHRVERSLEWLRAEDERSGELQLFANGHAERRIAALGKQGAE